MITEMNITALRMERLHFTEKATNEENDDYDVLFRDISPVPTVFWSSPGDPPTLPYHADFNDTMYNNRRRAARTIVKGRFQKGMVGYIYKDELELYAALYKKPIEFFTPIQGEILDLLRREGPMSIQYMKKITKHLIKNLSPALQQLQQAYLVFEDQVDSEWDRAWYPMETEFPDFDINRYTVTEALKIVVSRYAFRMVAFDLSMLKSFFKLPDKQIKDALIELVSENVLLETEFGCIRADDYELLKINDYELKHSAIVLQRSDILIRSYEHILKKRFEIKGTRVLQYILIEGEFHGAVYGAFRFSPNEIDDVILDDEKYMIYKEQIINGIYVANSFESPISKFMGKPYTVG